MLLLKDVWDSIQSNDVTTVGAVFKLALSMLLGSIVGLERKSKGQIAGDRTFALISMGATLAMLVSIYIPQEYLGLKNGDPGRIAAQVITGIGFLGAGAIIQMKGSVRGLTTAAGIWMVATIGLAVGAGMYLVSVFATLLVLFILVLLERYDRRVRTVGQSRAINMSIDGIIEDFGNLDSVLERHGVSVSDKFMKYDYTAQVTYLSIVIFAKSKINYAPLFEEIRSVMAVKTITLAYEMNI